MSGPSRLAEALAAGAMAYRRPLTRQAITNALAERAALQSEVDRLKSDLRYCGETIVDYWRGNAQQMRANWEGVIADIPAIESEARASQITALLTALAAEVTEAETHRGEPGWSAPVCDARIDGLGYAIEWIRDEWLPGVTG